MITGGEPCLFDLNPLCELLHEHGYSTQIETSGTFAIKAPAQTWVTVSPKINMRGGYDVLASAMQRADEIKHPVAMQKHVMSSRPYLRKQVWHLSLCTYSQLAKKAKATKLAIDTRIQKNWRLSVQVHKYIGIN